MEKYKSTLQEDLNKRLPEVERNWLRRSVLILLLLPFLFAFTLDAFINSVKLFRVFSIKLISIWIAQEENENSN